MRVVLKTWRIDGSRAHELGVGVQVAACNRDGWAPDDERGRGIEPRADAGARDRTRTVVERALEGDNPRRAPAARSSSGQDEGRAERTPGGSKASKRACRSCTASPVFVGSGRNVRRAFGCVVATGLATARNRRPGSRAGAIRGKRSWRTCGHRAGCGRNFEPARKQRLARASTAPRGGKALEGQLLDASGMKQGREASGSQNRREGQEPWGRHRRGSGRSSSRTGETRASAERSSRKRGTRRSCVREKEPHERRPGRGNRKGGDEALELWRGPEPHEGRSCDQNRATKVWRGIPRGRKDDVGGAPKPIGRYSSGTIKTLKGTDTSREWSSARVTARGSERRI